MSLRSDAQKAQTDSGEKVVAERDAFVASMYGDKKKKKVLKKRAGGVVDVDERTARSVRRVQDDGDEAQFRADAEVHVRGDDADLRDAPAARHAVGVWDADDNGGARRARHDSSDSDDDDDDAARRPAAAAAAAAAAPPAKRRRHDSDTDSDVSATRIAAADAAHNDAADSDSDLSVQRAPRARVGGADSDSDLSPPRKRAEENLMEDGTTAGLKTAEQQAEENRRVQAAKDEEWRTLDPRMMGEGAATVHRVRGTGKVVEVDPLQVMKDARGGKLRPQRELTEEQKKWGRGLRQAEEEEVMKKLREAEEGKPFAQREEDAGYQDRKRAVVRTDDPMARFLGGGGGDEDEDPLAAMAKQEKADRRREKKQERKEKKSKKELKKERKSEIEAIVDAEVRRKKVFQGIAPSNRFNIKPGYRWDGTDRGNGYEKRLFAKMAEIAGRDG